MASNNDFRDEVKFKLVNLQYFVSNPEDLVRVFHFLDESERLEGEFSPHWKNFKLLLNADAAFEALAKRYAADTKTAERDQQFRRVMHDMYNLMLKHTDDEVPLSAVQGFDLQVALSKTGGTFAQCGLARSWDMIPAETKKRILGVLPTLIDNRSLMNSVDETVSLSSKHGGEIVMYGVAIVYMTNQAIKSRRRWFNSEITGMRCAKNLIDASATTAGGIAGGVGGATLGTIILPGFGTIAGGIIGGIVGSNAAMALSDRLIQWLFGLPKDEAVENAYRYMDVKPTASNVEVNKAFRELWLKHHSDNGGNREELVILRKNMAEICLARGELLTFVE